MDLQSLKNELTAPGFDVEVHASNLIQSGADVAKYGDRLRIAEDELDAGIQEQVASHYEDLISQATGVERLETHLEMTRSHLSALSASAETLRARIREPHRALKAQTVTLSRLQETCDLLRRVIRTLQLGKRLQAQLQGGPQEMTKAALSLNELTELWVPELDHIDVIEQDQRMILHAKGEVERSADGMLARGMENHNQNQVGIAIQVFQNLSILEGRLDKVVESGVSQFRAKLASALDVRKITAAASSSAGGGGESQMASSSSTLVPGRVSGNPGVGNMAAFRATLWNNVEAVLDLLHNKCLEVLCLQQVLCKKRDAVSHAIFFEILLGLGDKNRNSRANVLDKFWSGAVTAIAERLVASMSESNFLKQALEGEYPKLLRLFNDLWSRLHQVGADLRLEGVMVDSGAEAELLKNPFATSSMDSILREALAELERAYLSRSLSRLFDPVNLMFSAGEVPTDTELHQVFKGVASEIGVAAAVDPHLSSTVGKNVAKTVKLTCVKCEQILVTDGEASQVVGYPTEGQKRNVAIVNCLSRFRAGIDRIIGESSLTREGTDAIAEALLDVDRQVSNGINPLLSSIEDAVEAIVLTIHKEDFSAGGDGVPDDVGSENAAKDASPYLKELLTFVSRVTADYLQDFVCRDFVSACLRPVVCGAISRFITHASLVRPMGLGGRRRLANDCSQLEAALEPLLLGTSWTASEEVAASVSGLRAFRALLFVQPQSIPKHEHVQSGLVRASTSLHLLFSFGPEELKSPHDSAGWSISRYSRWLEDHQSEAERLQLIQGTLESYVAATRARQQKSYAFPYPIMLEMLETFNK